MKQKREVLAKFYDHKGFLYELLNEKKKRLFDKKDNTMEEIKLYQGKELVQPWEVDKRKLDLSRSTESEVILLIEQYLKSSVNIKSCLQYMLFPFGAVMAIWNGVYHNNQIIKETVLKYQNVLAYPDFIESLTHKEKWVAFTQNENRSKDVMGTYTQTFQVMVSEFLQFYLSKKNIESHELLYGEWRSLIEETVKCFYSDTVREVAIKEAIQKTEREVLIKSKELSAIEQEIQKMDKDYERSTISEKLKMELDMKGLLKKEEEKKLDIEDTTEKMNRIKTFFTKEYLPLSKAK